MDKIARKTSDDPMQEHLRSSKDKWNKEVSHFIAKMIAFKRGVNGKGDPRVGMPPSRIQDPLPSEAITILEQLSNEYEILAQEAMRIADEQKQYSETRHKPQVVGPVVASSEYEMIHKEASWWGSRLLTRFQFGDGSKELRRELLNVSIDIKDYIKELDNAILSNDPSEIESAISNFKIILETYFENFLKPLNVFIKSHGEIQALPEPEGEEEISEIPEKIIQPEIFRPTDDVNDKKKFYDNHVLDIFNLNGLATLTNDEKTKSNLRKATSILESISAQISVTEKDNNVEKVQILLSEFENKYTRALNSANGIFGTNFDTFEKIVSAKKVASLEDEELQKFAANAISRWFKRNLLNLDWISDQSKRTRGQISSFLIDLKDAINDLMNILESKHLNAQIILSGVNNINVVFKQIGDKLIFLARRNNEKFHAERLRAEKKNKKVTLKEISIKDLRRLEWLVNKIP